MTMTTTTPRHRLLFRAFSAATTRTLIAFCLLVLALVNSAPAVAGQARATAMGGAHTAVARGLDAAIWNPAALGFAPGDELSLAGVAVDLRNNSFSLSRYNEITGATLSETQKERVIAEIPDGGLRLDATAAANLVGMRAGRFALVTGAEAAGRGNLDRDFFDLVLFGNEPGSSVDFSDTWGEGYAIGRLSAAWGQPVYNGPAGRVAVGATVSYLVGIYSVQVDEARGSLTTNADAVGGDAFAAAVTADGGSGYGVDLGAAWQAPGGWTFAMALDNALSHLRWSGNVERHEVTVTASGLSLLDGDFDEGIADSDTSYTAAAFTRNPPRQLRLGAAHDGGRWLVAADYAQGFSSRAGSSTTPQLNLGTEWRPLGWLSPRAGLAMGGVSGLGVAAGVGLDLSIWQLDLAVAHRGGLGNHTKGLGFGVSTQFVF